MKILNLKNLNLMKLSLFNISRGLTTQEELILTKSQGNKGIIIINRAKNLNALNLKVVQAMTKALKEYEKSKIFVMVKGAGEKSFSTGADIKAAILATKKGSKEGYDFFKTEYQMIGYISTYKIPFIAIIDGYVMGGGAGISIYGKYRIATEKTLFSMPESTIGLFVDAGICHFLSRMKGKLGMYLGLTGARLQGSDVLRTGIATHYCERSKLKNLENDILKANNEDEVKSVLKKYETDKNKLPPFSLEKLSPKIDHCFGASSVEGILKRLEDDGSDWAKTTLKFLMKDCSPITVKVSFHNMNLAAKLTLKETLIIDYRLAKACLDGHDFAEGTRALLIDKDKKPKWKPETYKEVTDEMIKKRFQKLPENEELKHI